MKSKNKTRYESIFLSIVTIALFSSLVRKKKGRKGGGGEPKNREKLVEEGKKTNAQEAYVWPMW
jgi:hypothetical protein